MEEFLEQFGTALTTDVEEDQSFKVLYKNWGKLNNQEERRKEILKKQKSDRNNKLDKSRGILKLLESGEEECESKPKYKPSHYVAGFTKRPALYNNVLMLSEWLIEKPEDLCTNWYVTPCPKAMRVLMVATYGKTKFYTKYGYYKFECQTLIPGGNRQEKRSSYSVLDGFYDKSQKIIYVMDVLAWNNQTMTDGELEFRQYWLQTKFEEEPGLGKLSKRNERIFRLLPLTSYEPTTFQNLMMSYPMMESAKTDGLLFLHKRGHYEAGETPLVGWLFPFMVPEILGEEIRIHDKYAAEKPIDYVDQTTYIQKFDEELKSKRGARKIQDSEMAECITQERAEELLECCPTDKME